jgi:hypothetical protein
MSMPAKTTEVFEYLKRCASEMRTVKYGEIGKETNVAPIGIGSQLGYIRDHVCREKGLPWLNAIAVSGTKEWRPGKGFLPGDHQIPEKDEERLWRGMVLQVFAFDWSQVTL